ncbi:MAG: bifunctional (p)ppGpp synthetase/guanosine-3',5'-bis(diphosphate) 3'-pyrophosphohydrolase [Eubacteriales bacterium]|nr:bifunctional (p)ppGpp synthetase/guanosine-3',5'-bis(diphosphate) 3'-pyrophosphohydrolase [Eubacteriales bacterium]
MDKLLAICEKKYEPEKVELVKKAIDFAKKVHADQKRESGEPYYIHPEAVALILTELQMDADTVIAGLLHDTVEDGDGITVEMIAEMFGDDIASMVSAVTKLTKSNLSNMLNREDRQAENLRRMFLSIARDVRVVIIKLADRLHNVRTLEYCSKEKRVRKAKETLQVYAPLADRFGMGAIKCELEDRCFSFIMPEEFRRLQTIIEPKQEERLALLKTAQRRIEELLNNAGIKFEISGRRKHIYSIYKKLTNKKCTINEIYDLVALRIIVGTVQDCYAVLGLVHQIWRPMPGRIKDYISMPKTNGYRSLHTTLFSEQGMPFEVQIRTFEMHRTAEYGIAAHWMYKEGRTKLGDITANLEWLRELVAYDDEANSSTEYVNNVRRDFFSDYVFALTPRGDIIDLPVGSTPIDFAYRIHTNVGNHVHHALVGNNMVRLDYKLKTNDVVTIVTSPTSEPSRNWLSFVKTSQAKSKIKQWLKRANAEENIEHGREMLSEAARRQGYRLMDIVKPEFAAAAIKKLNFTSLEDAYAAVGYGGISTNALLHPLLQEYAKARKLAIEEKQTEQRKEGEAPTGELASTDPTGRPIRMVGLDSDVGFHFCRCCMPVPGDPIIGYVTRGRGVSIHKASCTNARALMRDVDRIVEVAWISDAKTKFPVTIKIYAVDRDELLLDISRKLTDLKISLRMLNTQTMNDGSGRVLFNMGFEVNDAEQLSAIMAAIEKISGVESVEREN